MTGAPERSCTVLPHAGTAGEVIPDVVEVEVAAPA